MKALYLQLYFRVGLLQFVPLWDNALSLLSKFLLSGKKKLRKILNKE